MVESMAKQAARTVGSELGRKILRGVLGGILVSSREVDGKARWRYCLGQRRFRVSQGEIMTSFTLLGEHLPLLFSRTLCVRCGTAAYAARDLQGPGGRTSVPGFAGYTEVNGRGRDRLPRILQDPNRVYVGALANGGIWRGPTTSRRLRNRRGLR
jgi:hypothetical protein